jgi:molybdopterin molybdotransferase
MTRIEPSWDEAREIAFDFGKKLPIEVIDISHLIGRVIAIDARSLVDLPTYETSAMDGYVVCGSGPWKVVGEVKAGAPFRGTLNNGEALGIATGAVIPDGAFGVIRWENALVRFSSGWRRSEKRRDIDSEWNFAKSWNGRTLSSKRL